MSKISFLPTQRVVLQPQWPTPRIAPGLFGTIAASQINVFLRVEDVPEVHI